MKKFWLSLGLALMLACWCGEGYYGFGTRAAFGETYYYSRGLSCDPRDPYCYNEYYSAPYADPDSQFYYYVAPPVYERQETNREYRDRKRGDRIERERDRD
jgi:hypothetical protein